MHLSFLASTFSSDAEKFGIRAVVETSPERYNCWLVANTPQTAKECREGLCHYLGGDWGSSDVFHIGRAPGSWNPKCDSGFQSRIVYSRPDIFFDYCSFQESFVEKFLLSNSVSHVYDLLKGVFLKNKHEPQQAMTKEQALCVSKKQQDTEERALLFNSFKLVKKDSSYSYFFSVNETAYNFNINSDLFQTSDKRVDRSRLDWAALNSFAKFKSVRELEPESLEEVLREAFETFSVKFAETNRNDYLNRTVSNFLRQKAAS